MSTLTSKDVNSSNQYLAIKHEWYAVPHPIKVIEEISFFGDYIQYKIKLVGSNTDLIVSEMHSRYDIEWKLEDNVSVSWAEDSFVLFK